MRSMAAVAVMVGAPALNDGGSWSCSGFGPDEIEVTYAIPEGPGERGVVVMGCQDWAVDVGDGVVRLEPGWRSCAQRAWGRDGELRVDSPNVMVDGGEESQHVDFDLPTGAIGGMGLQIRATGRDVLVADVLPETPAGRLGLKRGDRITAVNGESTRGMSSRRFVRLATGKPGTPVDLEVARLSSPSSASKLAPLADSQGSDRVPLAARSASKLAPLADSQGSARVPLAARSASKLAPLAGHTSCAERQNMHVRMLRERIVGR